MLNIKSFFFNPLQTRCVVLWREGLPGCLVTDPGACDGAEREELTGFLDGLGLSPEKILLTHAHFDHVFAVRALRERYGCPVLMHPADEALLKDGFPTVPVHEGDTVTLGILRITNQRTGETERFEVQVTLRESRG